MQTIFTMSVRSLQYYVIARRWLSDLEFFKIETSYLHRLMDDYIIRLQDDAHIHKLIAAGKALQELEKMEVDDLLTGQITQLELMAEDIIPEDSESLSGHAGSAGIFYDGSDPSFPRSKAGYFCTGAGFKTP